VNQRSKAEGLLTGLSADSIRFREQGISRFQDLNGKIQEKLFSTMFLRGKSKYILVKESD